MLAQHLGFCLECFSSRYADKNDFDENGKPKEKPIKPLSYTDIATDHGFSDADTAKRACKKALKLSKRPLNKRNNFFGTFSVLLCLIRSAVVAYRVNNNNIAAVYHPNDVFTNDVPNRVDRVDPLWLFSCFREKARKNVAKSV